MLQFIGSFDSFCHVHHGIETASAVHSIEDNCILCSDSMGVYHPIKSIPLVCCNNGWCHKDCLKKKAFAANDELNCPLCQDEDAFQVHLLMNGIYIPNR